MAFPLKNHLKLGFSDESLDTSQGNTRLCPTVASKLKGGTIILVGSTALEKEKELRIFFFVLLFVALYLYKIEPNDDENKA